MDKVKMYNKLRKLDSVIYNLIEKISAQLHELEDALSKKIYDVLKHGNARSIDKFAGVLKRYAVARSEVYDALERMAGFHRDYGGIDGLESAFDYKETAKFFKEVLEQLKAAARRINRIKSGGPPSPKIGFWDDWTKMEKLYKMRKKKNAKE